MKYFYSLPEDQKNLARPILDHLISVCKIRSACEELFSSTMALNILCDKGFVRFQNVIRDMFKG